MAQVRSTSSTRVAPETRLIRAGARDCDLVKTVGPPIQKGSTVLLPNAAALYDDDSFLTYGRAGLAAHDALTPDRDVDWLARAWSVSAPKGGRASA